MPVYTYTTIDDPSALQGPQAFGINDAGQIVGSISGRNGSPRLPLSGGTFTTLDDPFGIERHLCRRHQRHGPDRRVLRGCRPLPWLPRQAAAPTPPSTIPWPSGTFCAAASTTRARSSGITGTAPAATASSTTLTATSFTTLDDPSATAAPLPPASTTSGSDRRILRRRAPATTASSTTRNGGTYTTLDDPLATIGTSQPASTMWARSSAFTTDGTGTHGFLYSGGFYTTIDDPLATGQRLRNGINDAGQIVGYLRRRQRHPRLPLQPRRRTRRRPPAPPPT